MKETRFLSARIAEFVHGRCSTAGTVTDSRSRVRNVLAFHAELQTTHPPVVPSGEFTNPPYIFSVQVLIRGVSTDAYATFFDE